MKNKITVSIAGQTYTLVASEESGYMEKVAAHVDAKIQEVLDESKVSLVDGAVLGEGCLVAAGALVPEGTVVPPYSLVVGVPGRVRGPVRPDQTAALAANVEEYRRLAAAHAAAQPQP